NSVDRIAQTNRMGGEEELRLERFMRNNPPIFKGGYDPEVLKIGLRELRGSLMI
ncbi:hypothetical protein A2U01_0092920, partial [Trifolium medium]|nr:hypothetical protein [Trifolium medium]